MNKFIFVNSLQLKTDDKGAGHVELNGRGLLIILVMHVGNQAWSRAQVEPEEITAKTTERVIKGFFFFLSHISLVIQSQKNMMSLLLPQI